MQRTRLRPLAAVWALAGLLLVACGASPSGSPPPAPASQQATTPAPAAPKQPIEISAVANWFAQPENAGGFAGAQLGIFEKHGLKVKMDQGGPQVSPVPLVAAGKYDFGMAQSFDILSARATGIPLVTIFTVFQDYPQVILTHPDVNSFNDLNGKTVFVQPGRAWWMWVVDKYKLKVNEVAYSGQIASWVADNNSAMQGYATSEPYVAQQKNVPFKTLAIRDSGFNPYGNVVFTTEKMIKEKPEVVKAFVEAYAEAWTAYFQNAQKVNEYLKTLNKDLDPQAETFAAEAEKPLVMGGDAATHGVGYMTKERWQTLHDQMRKLGVLKSDVDVSQAFTTQFLPKK